MAAKGNDGVGGFDGFSSAALGFLRDLEANNDRDWFKANRGAYDGDLIPQAKAFVEAMAGALRSLDPEIVAEPRINGSIFRMVRDVRFSKDKTPYKPHLDILFWRGERKNALSSFYFRMHHDRLHIGAGQHGFDKSRLATYRQGMAGAWGEQMVAVLEGLPGEYEVGASHYKRVPRGFDADHPRAEWLKFNGLHASRSGPLPATVGSADFLATVRQWMAPVAPVHELLVSLG